MALSHLLLEAYDKEEGNPHVVVSGSDTLSDLAITRSLIHARSKSMESVSSRDSDFGRFHGYMAKQLGIEDSKISFDYQYDNGVVAHIDVNVVGHFLERLFVRYGTVVNDGVERSYSEIVPNTYYKYQQIQKLPEDNPKVERFKEEITTKPKNQVFRLKVSKEYVHQSIKETLGRGFFNLVFTSSTLPESEKYRRMMGGTMKTIKRRSIASNIISEYGIDKDGNLMPHKLLPVMNAFGALISLFLELKKHGITNFNQYNYIVTPHFNAEANSYYEKLDIKNLNQKVGIYSMGEKVIIHVPGLEPAIRDLMNIEDYVKTYGRELDKTIQHFQDSFHLIKDVLKKGTLSDTYQFSINDPKERNDKNHMSREDFISTANNIKDDIGKSKLSFFSKEFGMTLNAVVHRLDVDNDGNLSVGIRLMTVTGKGNIGIGVGSRLIMSENIDS